MRSAAAAVGLSLIAGVSAHAQALPVRVAPGAKWTLEVRHVREEVRDGQPMSQTTLTRYAMALDDRSRLTLTRLGGEPAPTTPTERNLAATPIILNVDENLLPQGLVNEAELKAATEAYVAELTRDAPPVARAAMRTFLDSGFRTLAMREPQFIALSQGSDLRLGQTASYTTELPNPLGGEPITSIGSYALKAYDANAGRAVVEWRQGFDPQSASSSLRGAAGRLFEGAPDGDRAEVDKQLAAMVLDREDSCTHTIDIKTGLAVAAECLSEMRTAISGRVFARTDRWTFSQTLPETP